MTLSCPTTGTAREPTNFFGFSLPPNSIFQSIVDHAMLPYPSSVIISRYFAFFLTILIMHALVHLQLDIYETSILSYLQLYPCT
jgi:hypothetical protein